MPITPLHFGLIPLLNRATRRTMSEGAFVLANVVADIPVVLAVLETEKEQYGAPHYAHALHDVFTHNFAGALALGVVLGLFAFKKRGWMLGCILGALTHVGLDMFVHTDVAPFAPLTNWNPFYFDGAHAALSIALTVGLAIWILEYWGQRKASRLTEKEVRQAP